MYYLIGKSLKHSKSEFIHNKFSSINYKIKELNDIDEFFKRKEFKGINVTIPYKEECIKYLDVLDDKAKEIGAVNTVINKDGLLYGYNTDYDGFFALLMKNNIDVENKRVLILGTGGSSKTVCKVLKDLNAKSISFCSRSKSGVFTYEEVKDYDFELVINTTPLGMYPDNDDEPLINLNDFKSLEAVVDLIYNPLSTKLLSSIKGVKKVNGLYMLVYQAYKAHKYFIDEDIDISKVNMVYNELLFNSMNIVLIGMPMSGKSTLGKFFSTKFNKKFIDLDNEIELKENKTITELFNIGEDYFRNIESIVTNNFSKQNNLIIATGGGVIKNKKNIENLRQNGIIVFINRSLKKLLETNRNDRPLLKDKQSVIELYNERIGLYNEYADIIIDEDLSLEVLYETINSKWS